MKGSGNASDGVASGLLTMENLIRYTSWQLSGRPGDRLRGISGAGRSQVSPGADQRPVGAARSEQIEAAIRFWQRRETEDESSACSTPPVSSSTVPMVDGLDVEGIDAEGWVKDWLDRFTGGYARSAGRPPGLNATLRPYQRYGYSLARFSAALRCGCLSRRRHGPGQDDPDAGHALRGQGAGETLPGTHLAHLAHVGGQLGQGGRTLHAQSACPRTPGTGPSARGRLASPLHVNTTSSPPAMPSSAAMKTSSKPDRLVRHRPRQAQNIKNADTKQGAGDRHLGVVSA
ncbi:MAG: hypothetical protein R2856_26850 [Caldilineaceae bacterium]